MAGGTRFNPNSNAAASKTLPRGSFAKVTDLESGKSATVIEDRGPYVNERVIDVAPKVADQRELKNTGVSRVEVASITVPHVRE
jgi:rare lipoprotein A